MGNSTSVHRLCLHVFTVYLQLLEVFKSKALALYKQATNVLFRTLFIALCLCVYRKERPLYTIKASGGKILTDTYHSCT